MNLQQLFAKQNLLHWGICSYQKPQTLIQYKKAMDSGYFGSMNFLKKHWPQKENPLSLWTQRNISSSQISALVALEPYVPHPYPLDHFPFSFLPLALYAQGQDYHIKLKQKLQNIVDELKLLYPTEHFMIFVDSGPILERDLALQAGLGWIGKNTCLLNPELGSLFFIGEIFTTIPIKEFQSHSETSLTPRHPNCGSCDLCIKACPTQALIKPFELDSRKCLSYLSIETKNPIPEDTKKKWSTFFGCDICQNVCPWNQKILKKHSQIAHNEEKLKEELRVFIQTPDEQIQNLLKETALSRTKPHQLKTNAKLLLDYFNQKEKTDLK